MLSLPRIHDRTGSRQTTASLPVGLALALFLTIGGGPAQGAQEMYDDTGLPANHEFSVQGFDTVDLLNGNLHFEQVLFSARIGSGFQYELKLAYNSSVWNWYAPDADMRVGSKSSVGVGFRLHMGRIYDILDTGGHKTWFYEDPAGTPHELKRGSGIDLVYYYSQDSTFIRAQPALNPADGWTLWTPDGTRYELAHEVTVGSSYLPNWHGWYTTTIHSPVNPSVNTVTVTYDPSFEACILKIEDSEHRVINFSNSGSVGQFSIPGGYTQSVTVPAFGAGQQAAFSFGYQVADHIRFPASAVPIEANELMLTSLSMPDPNYALSFAYEDPNFFFGIPSPDGPVRKVVLKLGSGTSTTTPAIYYDYDVFTGNSRAHQQLSIKTVQSTEGPSYTWTYSRTAHVGNTDFNHPVRTDVMDPYGNATRYDFYGLGGNLFDPHWGYPPGWLYSVDFYHGSVADGEIVRHLQRVPTRTFANGIFGPPNDPLFGDLVTLSSQTITYVDDANTTVGIWCSEWVGPYCNSLTESNAGPVRGYTSDYSVPSAGTVRRANWVWNTFTTKKTYVWSSTALVTPLPPGAGDLADPTWMLTNETELSFSDDGRLQWKRDQIAPGLDSATGDVKTSITYNSGTGDPNSVTVEDPGDPASVRTQVYAYSQGHVVSAQSVGMPWKSLDVDRDVNTGLVAVSRDLNGAATVVSYDKMGRVTRVAPPGPELATSLSYASGLQTFTSRGDPGGVDYIYNSAVFDSLGRFVAEERPDQDGATLRRTVAYLGPEERVSVSSKWFSVGDANAAPVTSVFYSIPGSTAPPDPFGRAVRVVQADGAVTNYSHTGLTERVSTAGVNGDPNQVAETLYEDDALGRLARVTPPPPAASTVYSYDESDRLTRVAMMDPNGVAYQSRRRTYDALGRLIDVVEPETGEHQYLKYDVLGHVLMELRQSDSTQVSHTYDSAGRLLQTRLVCADPNSGLLNQRVYDQYGPVLFGKSYGHLTTEYSYPESCTGKNESSPAILKRTYNYSGLNGRLKMENLYLAEWDPNTKISTTYDWDALGRVQNVTYPAETGATRVVTRTKNTFTHGRLKSVDSPTRAPVLNNLFWSPSGALVSMTAGNWVATTFEPDSMGRPGRIKVQAGGASYFDTGQYLYDGVGNLHQTLKNGVATDTYTHDLAGRLVDAALTGNGYGATVFSRHYGYDPLGNMTRVDQPELTPSYKTFTVDPATNHINSMSTDPEVTYLTGNLTNEEDMTYGWDRRGRLASAMRGAQMTGTYVYDAHGLRIQKEDQLAHRKTYYLRDHGGRLLTEYARPSDSTLPPQWSKDYLYAGADLVAVVQNVQPLEPAGITSTATASTVHLAWTSNTEPDLFGYNVYRSTASGSGYQRLNDTSGTIHATSFDDNQPLVSSGVGLPAYYVITAIDTAGAESRYSTPRLITAGDMTQPSAPTGLTGQPEDGGANLSWSANSEQDIAGYDLYISATSTDSGGAFQKINSIPISALSYEKTGLAPGGTYYFKLKAMDTAGNPSSYSGEVWVTTHDPNAPPGSGGGSGGCDPHCMPGIGALSIDGLPEGVPSESRYIGTGGAQDWVIYYVHTDHLGSVRAMTDLNGQLVMRENYFPFGKEMPDLSGTDLSKSFTGHERDAESGLYYMLARYYSPDIGRFLSPDPWKATRPADTQAWNEYSYVSNSPMSHTDPYGLFSLRRFVGQVLNIQRRAAGLYMSYAISNALMYGWNSPQVYPALIEGLSDPDCQPPSCTYYKVTPHQPAVDAIVDVTLSFWVNAVTFGRGSKGLNLLGRLGAQEGKVALEAAGTAARIREAEVAEQLLAKTDAFHRAPTFLVDEIAEQGTVFDIVGEDGVARTLVQLPAEVNGIGGRVEWLVGPNGLEHQVFVEGGTINGIPNVP
ncbi:MAG: hypothetical protein HY049_07970 [Acidobacteria bacterium]|nr:hypothetical protein [Acidobacteriota bacterium]